MNRTPPADQGFRVMRSLLMIVILTSWSTYSIVGGTLKRPNGHAFPHGNPIVYSLAMSWLIAITIAFLSSAIFFRVNPTLFSLAHWEKEGRIYDRAGIRAFRWVLLHSPLGWINPNFHLGPSRIDCDRLLREMNSGEAVHWLTCVVTVMVAISHIVHGYVVYGYVMLLVRIPFDLYPIMLQRWNRGRVSRILEHRQARPMDAPYLG